MSKDYYRFFYVLLVAFIAGLIFDHLFLILFVATLGCLVWQQQKLSQLFNWIQSRDKTEAPDVPGNFEDICIEIDRQQLRHKKRKKKLAGYLQQFHQATSALPDATIVLDSDDKIQWANKAAASLLNIQWPQDQRQRITNLIRSPGLERFLRGVQHDQLNALDIKSPFESEVYLSLRVVPYGKNQRLFVARDVTRLQKLIEVRKDFVANVSHELRTPLTVLRGYLETLLQTEKFDQKQLELSLSTMNDQSIRMEDVINDLLTISRLEEGRFVTKPEVVVVPEMIRRIHQEAVALSGDKQHLFKISAEAELWIKGSPVDGDRYLVHAGAFQDGQDEGETHLGGDGARTYAIRVAGTPWMQDKNHLLHVGGSYMYIDNRDDGLRVRQRAISHLDSSRMFNTGTLSAVENVNAFDVEAVGVFGPFHALFEYVNWDLESDTSGQADTLSAWSVEAGWFFTGESMKYKKGQFSGVSPKSPFMSGGGLGAWQAVARYENMNLNDGSTEGGDGDVLSIGLNWTPIKNVRFMATWNKLVDFEQTGNPNDGAEPSSVSLRAMVYW